MKNVKPPSWERCSSKEKQPEKWGKTYHNKAAALYTSAFGNRISNSYNSCFASRGSLWQICAWWFFVGDIPRLGYCLGRQGASNVIAFFFFLCLYQSFIFVVCFVLDWTPRNVCWSSPVLQHLAHSVREGSLGSVLEIRDWLELSSRWRKAVVCLSPWSTFCAWFSCLKGFPIYAIEWAKGTRTHFEKNQQVERIGQISEWILKGLPRRTIFFCRTFFIIAAWSLLCGQNSGFDPRNFTGYLRMRLLTYPVKKNKKT